MVEACPTSNRPIAGIADPHHHPVHQFLAWRVPLVIGSDYPGSIDTTLADEISWIVDAAKLGTGAFEERAAQGVAI